MGQYLAFMEVQDDMHRFLGDAATDGDAKALCEREAHHQGLMITWVGTPNEELGVTNWTGTVRQSNDAHGFTVEYIPDDAELPPLPDA
ncbi:hypothetical protein [Deinococcus soli (ex Cha et al. 2016)]|uniref:Uncharacterized protein n=2 Tax=Deinococcus soli (ex Cha et al. 2016) TaxID=1309411 RepID=A0AAE3XDU6_9DEIO|nr:hypothetical protein [Deinococcus soli (ex Cha et al. 2016)]MDR6218814.1 hypothetical protein [Deinococcus soli (ex Cha et al. 2016)]MDR6328611.1 hypothetical protein [Deinococcus soli (ex Cha et al. 2016)]MDR6751902.1 hypothetical protein [Deinococcus soli (ex Cha et al. 2016)]